MANEHSNIVPSMQPTAKVADFKFWCQKVLPLVYDDSLSYYEVLNKMVVYLNQVIANVNADIDNIAELEDDFLLLQSYVNNFFDDIDQLVTYAERAEAAETSAISYAASAAESATNASTSSLAAMDAKDAAVAAKNEALSALASAQSAATSAAESATNAASSALTALDAKDAAAGSALSASGSATNASASATAAQQSFTLADAARVAAQSAANDAETAAELIDMDATASDVGKAIIVKTVSGGKVTAYEFGESGSGGGGEAIVKTISDVAIASFGDGIDSPVEDVVADISAIQKSGTPTQENPKVISGWVSCSIDVHARNLLTFVGEKSGKRLSNDGTLTNANYAATSDYLRVKPSITIYGKQLLNSGSGYAIAEYDKNKTFIRTQNANSGTGFSSKQYTLSNNTYYIRCTYPNDHSGNPAILLSGTTYETYKGDTYTSSWNTEAGTVYGGRINFTKGKLTVTHGYIESYNGEEINEPWISSMDVYTEGTTPTTGAQVVYPLTTAIEYDLTSIEVKTIEGLNNVFANSGNINTLKYVVNEKQYIDTHDSFIKSAIAPVLTSFVADTALVANDFRFVGDDLYRITAPIASGGTITPNTNATKTTVGEVLKALLNA